jgi:hypothetical protein
MHGKSNSIRREVSMPAELVHEIRKIVHAEGYTALIDAFPASQHSPVCLSKEEAEALITLAVIERRKAWLRYPFYCDSHPRYSPEHEEGFADVQMGLYEKVLYYVGSAFSKEDFRPLL